MAGLLLNKVPRPEEKAALAEALYHALKDFSSRGPAAIANRETRRFETVSLTTVCPLWRPIEIFISKKVRIFLAHLASAADAGSTATAQRPVEEISLICAVSRKRLLDPVLFNSAVVGRTAAALHQRGGALYRPNHSAPPPQLLELSNTDSVVMLLPCVPGLTGASATATLLLRVSDIGWPPRAFMAPLDTAARDFIAAIRRANQTDLVSQGPLDLKSVDVVPPRIVVDQEASSIILFLLLQVLMCMRRDFWRSSRVADVVQAAMLTSSAPCSSS